MSKEPERENGLSRRKFLKGSAGAAVALGCFGTLGGLKEALAQAKAAGKPLLTEANINEHIAFSATVSPERRNHPAFAQQVREFKIDPKSYLTKHFHVTPSQLAEFASMDRKSLSDLYEMLDRCVKEKLPFMVKIVPPDSDRRSGLNSPLEHRLVSASLMRPRFIFHCDSDRGCTFGWRK